MRSVAVTLARAILAGEFTESEMRIRCEAALGAPWPWLRRLIGPLHSHWLGKTRPRVRDVTARILEDKTFNAAIRRYGDLLRPAHFVVPAPAEMQPHGAARDWNLPAIETPGALAQWLSITTTELDWFADVRGLLAKQEIAAVQHYHYRTLTKKAGGVRLIESPKTRLKEMQRRLLSKILERIPAHQAAHGFVKRHSVKTFLTPHVGAAVLLRLDLQNFFPTITAARLQSLFRMLGYPDGVADFLTGLTTTVTARSVWTRLAAEQVNADELQEAKTLYGRRHLPQGAPTSPALANICAYRMDCRLSGLAKAAGGQYTRYADDLAFSGGTAFAHSAERFSLHAAAVIAEEGFVVHHRKTRVMRQGVRQHMAGLVTNEKLNLMRPDFDRLKAILTNCIRTGPAAQNRDEHPDFRAHLEGRVAHAEQINAAKAPRLRALLMRVVWN